MNVGEKHYCSKCMREIEEYGVCPHCGYDPDALTESFCIEEGTLFQNGRYELGAVIGQGGFGITYAAWDMVLDIPVAIKEYFPREYCKRNTEETDDIEITNEYFCIGLQTFIREARILATLQNVSTVVQVYDCFEKNNTAYIIMEYVRGETLLEMSQRKKLKSTELLILLRPVFDDLILVHKAGVLHRDISPNNILVQENGCPKLIDFGAAMNLSEDALQNPSLNLSFAAPEQYSPDGKQGFETDVYGLSATIYTVMTGKIIQDAKSRMVNDKVKKPVRLDKVSKRIIKAVFRGLRLDPKKRTHSIEELRADVYHLPKPIVTKRQKVMMTVKVVIFLFAFEFGIYVVAEGISEKWFDQICDTIGCYIDEDTDYALELADNYREGKSGDFGYRRNYEKSLYWYKWAADHGNQRAMFDYALILQKGEITDKNIPEAISYYEKVAGEVAPMAWNNLGYIYMQGDGVEKDEKKALQYIQKAAEYDVGLSLANLGLLYVRGEVVEKDLDKAIDYLERAVAVGEPMGMYHLAVCYSLGEGVKQSDIEWLRLLYEAAVLECPEAMCAIGQLYENGDLGFIDYEMAYIWYSDAQELHYAGADYYLAHYFQNGQGYGEADKLDEQTASLCMLEAAENEYEPAYEEVLQMAKDGYGIFKDEEKAAEIIGKYE